MVNLWFTYLPLPALSDYQGSPPPPPRRWTPEGQQLCTEAARCNGGRTHCGLFRAGGSCVSAVLAGERPEALQLLEGSWNGGEIHGGATVRYGAQAFERCRNTEPGRRADGLERGSLYRQTGWFQAAPGQGKQYSISSYSSSMVPRSQQVPLPLRRK